VNNTSLSDLSRIAVEDGKRKYTYGLMFREWERYASVFTALGMTGAEVSLIPAYSAFTPGRIMQTIRSEKLTDFIITDDFAQQNLINDLLANQKELGLRNIIVLHVPVAGVTVNRALRTMQETKYAYLKAFLRVQTVEALHA
jgi:hypothetical protein